MRATISLLALPLVAAIGCAPGEQAEEQEQASRMEAASEGEMAGGTARDLTLMALNNSGITGTAQVSHTADAMTVVLSLEGLTAGESYAAHIHSGKCEEGGPPVVTLETVQAQDGTGTSTTSVPMSELMGMKAEDDMAGDDMAEGEAMDEAETMGEGEMMDGEGEMMDGEDEMMDGEEKGYYIQVHNPDGSPAACVNIETAKSTNAMQ